MMLISMTASVPGSDCEGAKPGPLTASMVCPSFMFMCGASAEVSLAGEIRLSGALLFLFSSP